MTIVVNDERTLKEKLKDRIWELKTKMRNKLGEMKRWTEDHYEAVLRAIPVLLAIATGVIKLIKTIRGTAAERHEARMDKAYYDPSSGFHWDLKRNLNNTERIEILQRRREGENIEDILASMRVLRK